MTAGTENTDTLNSETEVRTEAMKTESEDIKTEPGNVKVETEDIKKEPEVTINTISEDIKTEPEDTKVKAEDTKIKSEDVKDEGKSELKPIITDGIEVDPGTARRIVKQLEYYFGDRNLRNDRFMLREVTLDNGWISLDTMLNFKRLAGICSDKGKIAKAVETSNSNLVVINEDKNKIRRNPGRPLPQNTDEAKQSSNLKTVYVKGLPLDLNIDQAEEFFQSHGNTTYIKLRKDREGKFKGSVFLEFEEQSTAEKFLTLKELKYSEGLEPLLILSRQDYWKSKDQSYKKEKNEKREYQLGGEDVKPFVPQNVEYEKGKVLKIPQLSGVETSREDMKDLFAGGISWITYNKGDSEAFIRFDGNAQEALDKVCVEGKFVLSENELHPVVLEGDEEEGYWRTSAQEKAEFFHKKSITRKRRPDGRGRGRGFKRSRRD